MHCSTTILRRLGWINFHNQIRRCPIGQIFPYRQVCIRLFTRFHVFEVFIRPQDGVQFQHLQWRILKKAVPASRCVFRYQIYFEMSPEQVPRKDDILSFLYHNHCTFIHNPNIRITISTVPAKWWRKQRHFDSIWIVLYLYLFDCCYYYNCWLWRSDCIVLNR